MNTTARFIILSILVSLLLMLNILLGSIPLSLGEVFGALTGSGDVDSTTRYIVIYYRLPAAIMALVAGGGLAVTGLMLQTVFRNPLAGPSILGISSGASLGVAIVMLLFGGTISVSTFSIAGYFANITGAMAGSLLIIILLLIFSARIKGILTLLILGMMTGYFTSSVVTLLSSLATAQGIQGYVVWGMGTFGGVTTEALPWVAGSITLLIGVSFLFIKQLNILLLGDYYAKNLGLNISKVRTAILTVAGILTATITAYCGPISFIGLAMPHICRMIWPTDNHRILLPGTMLCGSIVACGCNLMSTTLSTTVIPVNALTPLIGVPVILYVMLKRR